MLDFLYFSGLISLTLFPTQSALLWLYDKSKDIQHKLDVDPSYLRFSRFPLLYALIIGLQLLKGYLIPLATDYLFFYNDIYLLISIIATFSFHLFSPFNGFRKQPYGFLVLVGIGLFIDIKIGLFLLIVSCLLSLLTNSFVMGTLITLFLSLFFVWSFQFPIIYLVSLLACFCILFLSSSDEAIRYFSKKPITLYTHFKNR